MTRSGVESVHLLTDGRFEIDMGLLVYAKEQYYGKKYFAELLPLLVVTRDGPILVDSGMGEQPPATRGWMRIERQVSLVDSLARHGFRPEDVRAVVNTHLHWDHCGNDRVFREAEIVVQARELAYARNPDRFQKGGYHAPTFEGLRYREMDGAGEVVPGVRVVLTPGHTPGHQSVIVETRRGKVVYTGDASPLRENLERRNIVGIVHDPVKALESLDYLRSLPGHFIVSHEQGQTEEGFELAR